MHAIKFFGKHSHVRTVPYFCIFNVRYHTVYCTVAAYTTYDYQDFINVLYI